MVYTTLRKLKDAGACKDRYAHLVQALGGGYSVDTLIDLIKILETNGLNDVLWIPRSAVDGDNIDIRYRLLAVACCQDVLHLMPDQRSRDAVKMAHLFAHGEVTQDELAAARAAARAAAWAAAWDAARDAARGAAWAAARDAARDAARGAAWGAAWEKQVAHFKAIFSFCLDQ